MNDVVIQAEGLSKRYLLGELARAQSGNFREIVTNAIAGPIRRLAGIARGPSESDTIWALKDVSFDVRRGEVLGVVGRNGAGKSTLLKILSRITAPTSGEVRVRGRLASLLEVGTGFHPELTGRENIYLNGAILGMKRAEIAAKFDRIAAFSEIERFLDTPVKRYSSGMYVRLAFAVAAHLEADILLIDEVLAVGDVAFQRKCLDKMDEVKGEGRTVLFVSHNAAAIQRLCPKCLWLEAGAILAWDYTPAVYEKYLSLVLKTEEGASTVFPEDPEKDAQLLRVTMVDEQGQPARTFQCDQRIAVEMDYMVRRPVPGLYGYLQISGDDGTPVMVSVSDDVAPNPLDGLPAGSHKLRVVIPARTLGHGRYRVTFSTASQSSLKDYVVDAPGPACAFTLEDRATLRGDRRGGFFSTILDWKVSPGEK